MSTLFEIVVVGDDIENLTAAAEAGLDEIVRIEKLLSRFDPASETARINRHAATEPVLVDFEMRSILRLCLDYQAKTGGHFDITATSRIGTAAPKPGKRTRPPHLLLDDETRMVRFSQPGVQLNFGAFGKGYALDRAAKILTKNGVQQALLHGGTSSVLALGNGPDNHPWRVGIRNPFLERADEEISQLRLCNQALSSSAVVNPGQTASDIVNPLTGAHLKRSVACVVIGPTATETEMLSTAFLSMGKAAATLCCQKLWFAGMRAGWIARQRNRVELKWLKE